MKRERMQGEGRREERERGKESRRRDEGRAERGKRT